MDGPIDEPALFGRDAEIEVATTWRDRLANCPAGLLIEGEAGIGKTSVWLTAIGLASQRGARLLVSRPVERELTLGYAGLGDLLQGFAGRHIPELPGPQAQALSAALSLAVEPEPGDPLLVARATLSLLRLLAAEAPVVIAIDDVQWLDASSVRALAFAVRRLGDAPVGVALTVRDHDRDPIDLAEAMGDRSITIRLGGLSLGAIGHLVGERVAPEIRRRYLLALYDQFGGNPFFALELARAGVEADGLPPMLHDLVLRRLDQAASGLSDGRAAGGS